MNSQNPNITWIAVVIIVVGIAAVVLLTLQSPPAEPEPLPTRVVVPTSATTPTPTTEPTETPVPTVALPTPTFTPVPLELPAVEPPSGGNVYMLTPTRADVVGWVRQIDDNTNHLGDYNIYAGIYDSNVHLGAMQFDLSSIPPGTPILHADLTLMGLSDEFLGAGGIWSVEMLEPWMNQEWSQVGFHALVTNYNVLGPLLEPVTAEALGRGKPNTFFFPPQALPLLEAELYRGAVAFRVIGPVTGENNLFSWDSGFGAGSLAQPPLLRIIAGAPPDVAPPSPTPKFVIITPETENIVERAAAALTMTAEATPYVGEETPTPTPTFTPMPPNWVTPVIITNTPVPENSATAEWQIVVATAQALVMGTPTPFPVNLWTATPTPGPTATSDIILFSDLTPTPTPTATPEEIPPVLDGKILFLSNRFGEKEGSLMVMNADGSDVAIWAAGSDGWVYRQARAGQDFSPDGLYQVVVSDRQLDTEAKNLLGNPPG